MDKLRVGVCGLGCRGFVLSNILLSMPEVDVRAGCDLYDFRRDRFAAAVKEKYGKEPFVTDRYENMVTHSDIDAVLICASWEAHVDLAVRAMEEGKITALEVGGAYSLDDCWRLVRTYEKTKTPFFFMENCCYNKDELLATSLVRAGVFGDIVHCHGCYGHDLREEVAYGEINKHYRLRNYLMRNCENYPTHELGPIAKILGVNRGNRMLSLVSVASRAAGMAQYIRDKEDERLYKYGRFMQADIVNTIIRCADGSTITLRLDTTLPRVYDREFTVRGTKGLYMQTIGAVIEEKDCSEEKTISEFYGTAARYEKEYLPDEWLRITENEIKSGHGGMDAVMLRSFVGKALRGEEMPLDVYDAASWMSVSCLSEQSIDIGGAPVAIPDFTNGKWLMRENADVFPLPDKTR